MWRYYPGYQRFSRMQQDASSDTSLGVAARETSGTEQCYLKLFHHPC